jgi:dynein light chain LC8-type
MKVHKSDVTEEMASKAIARINEAMDKHQIEKVVVSSNIFIILTFVMKDIAAFIKKKADEDFTGTWHCIVGRNFGCSITHDTLYVYFVQVDQVHVLLFKSFE